MRIDCDKCGAAYAIDDAYITEQGVRAQCPKCGEQKVVRKENRVAADPFAGFSDTGSPSPASVEVPSADPFLAVPAGPSSTTANGQGGQGVRPTVTDPFHDLAVPPGPTEPTAEKPGLPLPAPAAIPETVVSRGSGQDPFANLPDLGPPRPSGAFPLPGPVDDLPEIANPFALEPAPAEQASMTDSASPFSTVDDSFSGIGQANRGSGADDQAAAAADLETWHIRLSDERILGPLTTEEVRGSIRSGEIDGGAEVSRAFEESYGPISDERLFVMVLRAASRRGVVGGKGSVRGASVRPRSPKALAAVVVVLGLIGGVAAVFLYAPDWIARLNGRGVDDPFIRQVELWRLQYPAVEGTCAELVRRGREQYLSDRPVAYLAAEQSLRKALLKDVNNSEAVAAYVENLARIPDLNNRMTEVQTALAGLESALKRGETALLYRAKGALFYAVGNDQAALDALNRARQMLPTDAETLLLLAEVEMQRNTSEALELLEKARGLDPTLKRLNGNIGKAFISLGKFRAALVHLDARLVEDPGHVSTLLDKGRLLVMVGEWQQAAETLQAALNKSDELLGPRLMLAQILYQAEGRLSDAEAHLQKLTRGLVARTEVPAEVPDVFTHFAWVRALQDDLEGATKLTAQALTLKPAHHPASYLSARLSLRKAQPEKAIGSLGAVLSDPDTARLESLARTALGDAYLAARKPRDATQQYERATERDPVNPRAYLGLAAAHAELGDLANTAMAMRRLFDVDPDIASKRFELSPYPRDIREYRRYLGVFETMQVDADDRTLMLALRGVALYHMQRFGEAEVQLQASLAEDAKNPVALTYLGASLLRQDKTAEGLRMLRRALTENQRHVVTRYLLSQARMLSGDLEGARRDLEAIRQDDNSFVSAVSLLGDLHQKLGDHARASALYQQAYKADPMFLPAKRGLFVTERVPEP